MPESGSSPRARRTLCILSLAVLAFVLAQTMVIPALPAIGLQYAVDPSTTTWLVTGFLLSASTCAPLAGRLGDMFGKSRALLVVLSVFATGLVIATAAPSFQVLLAARILQGAGSAVVPLSLGILRDAYPPDRVARAVGFLSAMLGFGSAFGVVLAGVYVDYLSVRWIFATGALLTVGAAVTTWRFIPKGLPGRRVRIDWLGALLMCGTLTCLLLAVSEGNEWGWSSAPIAALFVGTAILLLLFIVVSRRRVDPFLDVQLLARRAVWSNNMAAVGVGFALFGSLVLIPQLVQSPASTGYGLGATASASALVMLPGSVLMLLGGPLSGWLATRIGPRLPLAVGAAAAAGAYFLLASRHGSFVDLAVGGALSGLSVGMAIAALGNLTLRSVGPDQSGVTTGINTVSRTVGGAIGSQLTAAFLAASALATTGLPSDIGFSIAFATSGIASLVALGSVMLIPRTPRQPQAIPRPGVPAASRGRGAVGPFR